MSNTIDLYQSFERAYSFFNRALFNSRLPHVLFTLQRKKGALGYFAANRWEDREGSLKHEIAINPLNLTQLTLIDVLSTLVHEMAHCWQYCFGTPSRSGYHNREWSDKMVKIGLQPSSTRQPGGKTVGQKMSHYPIAGGKFMITCDLLISVQGEEIFPLYFSASQGLTAALSISNTNPLFTRIDNFLDLEQLISARSNTDKKKATYTCDFCKTKVWGKPGLKLVCGLCGYQYLEEGRRNLLSVKQISDYEFSKVKLRKTVSREVKSRST